MRNGSAWKVGALATITACIGIVYTRIKVCSPFLTTDDRRRTTDDRRAPFLRSSVVRRPWSVV